MRSWLVIPAMAAVAGGAGVALGVTPEDPAWDRYTKRLGKVRQIADYQYVMHVLERDLSYEEVAEIFVRVNSLVMKLRGSDLSESANLERSVFVDMGPMSMPYPPEPSTGFTTS